MFKLNNKVGKIGEDTACVFLINHGFVIKERNFWKKWGEIDIIAEKGQFTHFIEVKSVVCKEGNHEFTNGYKPEENVHSNKLKRLRKVISTYIIEKKISEHLWHFDVIAVFLNTESEQARIKMHENLII